jgi:hypothetical protein
MKHQPITMSDINDLKALFYGTRGGLFVYQVPGPLPEDLQGFHPHVGALLAEGEKWGGCKGDTGMRYLLKVSDIIPSDPENTHPSAPESFHDALRRGVSVAINKAIDSITP